MKEIKICPHCGKPVIKSDLPEYVWQCVDCDEDFYDFECRMNLSGMIYGKYFWRKKKC